MPDTDRRGQTTVTLPMAELLAEARLPSPWDGLEGQASFDHILAQTIDELDVMDRVRACQRIDEATDQERRLLIAIACYGWTTSASYEALSRDTGIRGDLISRHANRLKSREILRITTVHLSKGGRIRLFTLSGRFLMRAYRRWRGDGSTLDDLPSAPSSALDDLVTNRPISPPSTLVSSVSERPAFDKRLTDLPAAPKSRALDDLPSAPGWFDRFTGQVGRIPAPTPKPVRWPSLASLLDLDLDPEAEILGEACARFLDVYSQPRHAPVRSLRAVVRSIYQGLLQELGSGVGQARVFYATETWFAEEPVQPELMPEIQYGPFPWEAVADAEADTVWSAVLESLRKQLPRPTYETWVRPTRGIAIDERTMTVAAPTPFAVEWLEHRIFQTLQRTLHTVSGRPLELVLRVRTAAVSAVYTQSEEELS